MLAFGDSMLAWGLVTFASAAVGLAVFTLAAGLLSPRIGAAFGLGVFLWFFVDTLQGSSNLLVNEGFGGGAAQLAMVLLFLAGLFLFFQGDKGVLSGDPSVTSLLPALAALALGLHGLGEGSAFGSTASQTSSTSLLGVFGGPTAGAAYALHKMLEPAMAGALYVAFSRGSGKGSTTTVRDLLLLALLFTLPSILGAASGYYLSYDSTYFFALGAGASVYVAFRLARQVFLDPSGASVSRARIALAASAGFILIYISALLHS